MPQLITQDDVDELELAPFPTDDRLRDRVATFIAWATDDAYELDGDVTRAYLLTAAAEHLVQLRDLDGAMATAELAGAQSDAEPFEAAPVVAEIHLERGDLASALAVSDEVRRARIPVPWVAEQLGELFEAHDELAVAERWFTIGSRYVNQVDGRDDEYERMLTARWRVRHAAGKPLDGIDEEALELRESLGFGVPYWEQG